MFYFLSYDTALSRNTENIILSLNQVSEFYSICCDVIIISISLVGREQRVDSFDYNQQIAQVDIYKCTEDVY
jgi:hypothetical protein